MTGMEAEVVKTHIDDRGSVTLAREVCERLGLHPGDEVQVRVVGDRILELRRAGTGDPMSLAGSIEVDHPITLDDMERAIAEGAAGG